MGWHDRLEVIQQKIGLKPVFTDGDSFSFKSVKTSRKRDFALDCSKVAVSLEQGREVRKRLLLNIQME